MGFFRNIKYIWDSIVQFLNEEDLKASEKAKERNAYFEARDRLLAEEAAIAALTPEEREARIQAMEEERRKQYEAMMENQRKREEEEAEEERREQLEREEKQKYPLIAYESFLRRASSFDHPFVLKGGFSLRQYFDESLKRISGDIDWVYSEPLMNEVQTRQLFNDWLKKIIATEIEGDKVVFEEIKDTLFWNLIDYADSDDFPTTGTEIRYRMNNGKYKEYISIQVSFNIELQQPAVSFTYNPYKSTSFVVPKAIPLAVQIGWKLHQTISRPRYKDVFDLIHLLAHPSYNDDMRQIAIQELVNECSISGEKIQLLEWFITDKAARYSHLKNDNQKDSEEFIQLVAELERLWGWYNFNFISISDHYEISSNEVIRPESLEVVLIQFSEALNKAGFTMDIFNSLPAPSRTKVAYTSPIPPES